MKKRWFKRDEKPLKLQYLIQLFPDLKFTHEEIDNIFRYNYLENGENGKKDRHSMHLENSIFDGFIGEYTNTNSNIFFIPLEAQNTLKSLAPQLNLPSPGLVHIFWALHFANELFSGVPQTYKIRTLAHHLLSSRIDLMEETNIHLKVGEQIFDYVPRTIDWCLKTGMFENMHNLIEKGIGLCTDRPSESKIKRAILLAQICKDALAISANEQLSGLLIELNNLILEWQNESTHFDKQKIQSNSKIIKEKATDQILEPDRIETLSLETVNSKKLKQSSKQLFDLEQRGLLPPLNSNALNDFTELQLTWLSLTLSVFQFSPNTSFNFLFTTVDPLAGIHALNEKFEKIVGRIQKYSRYKTKILKDDNPIDFLSLSMCIWNRQLFNRSYPDPLKNYDDLLNATRGLLNLANVFFEKEKFKKSSLFIKKEERSITVQSDYFLQNFIAESCILMLARFSLFKLKNKSFFTDHPQLSSSFENNLTQLQKLIYFFDSNEQQNEIVDQKDQQRLIKIDLLLNYCILMWISIGHNELASRLQIKRLQLRTIIRNFLQLDLFESLEEKYDIAPFIEEYHKNHKNITSVLAKFSQADFYRGSVKNISSFHFYKGLKMLLEAEFGLRLKKDAAMLGLTMSSSSIDVNFESIFMFVMEGDYLRNYFLQLNLMDGFGAFLHINSHIQLVDLKEYRTELMATLQRVTDEVDNEYIKDYFLFDTLRSGDINNKAPDEIIKVWFDKMDSPVCANVMNLCLSKGVVNEDIKLIAEEILQSKKDFRYTAYMDLAESYARKYGTERESVAIQFMRQNIRNYEGLFPASAIVELYRLLLESDKDNLALLKQKKKWQEQATFENTLKDITILATKSNNNSFEIFKRQYLLYEDYGIVNHSGYNIIPATFFEKNFDSLLQAASWKKEFDKIPEPIKYGIVSLDFIQLGAIMFDQEVVKKTEYSLERQMINEMARIRMNELIEIILLLPDLSFRLRNIYQEFLTSSKEPNETQFNI